MASFEQVGYVVGGAFGGETVHVLGLWADKATGKDTATWYKRYSTYVDLVGGTALIAIPFMTDINDSGMENLMFAAGGTLIANFLGTLVKERLVNGSAPAMASARNSLRITPRMNAAPMFSAARSVAQLRVTPATSVGTTAKYLS